MSGVHELDGSDVGQVKPHAEEGPSESFSSDPTWTFARAEDELTIVHPRQSGGCALKVVLNATVRTFAFRDAAAAMKFQSDMETLLTHTGWSFVGFSPDRRGRRDRRQLPRANERRRWWTDGWLFSND